MANNTQPTIHFQVGDLIFSDQLGVGIITKIERKDLRFPTHVTKFEAFFGIYPHSGWR